MVGQPRRLACASADACENCAAYTRFIDDVVALHEDGSAVAGELTRLVFEALHGSVEDGGWTRLYVGIERVVRSSGRAADLPAQSRLAAFLAENSDLGLENAAFS